MMRIETNAAEELRTATELLTHSKKSRKAAKELKRFLNF